MDNPLSFWVMSSQVDAMEEDSQRCRLVLLLIRSLHLLQADPPGHLEFTPHTPWLLLCTDSWSCSQEDCTGGQLHAGVVTQAVLCHAECR